MQTVLPRPLSAAERALVDHMIRAAGETTVAPSQVVAKCECGCASIDFIADTAGARVGRDAIGRTPGGVEVGALLWVKDGRAAGLEIYMFGTDTAELPLPESLQFEPFAPAS
jgi:hypothetical protein